MTCQPAELIGCISAALFGRYITPAAHVGNKPPQPQPTTLSPPSMTTTHTPTTYLGKYQPPPPPITTTNQQQQQQTPPPPPPLSDDVHPHHPPLNRCYASSGYTNEMCSLI